MLKKLLKLIKSSVVSGLSRIAPRNTNRPVEFSTVNLDKEILTYKLLIAPERDSIMVVPNEVPHYSWSISARQEQELTDVFTSIGQERFW